ncbi:carboxypeptidase regulatory-like domain-containing protein [Fibrella sp. HMF5335]|uniref:Carboxypeptidase regulatory-like domain-containing protein n=1 Tax=Fibrella rubiginis TaxID=2817060 RepID=A0A939GMK7_9BACT|nr:carboxypeptidase regulatory-like domain-containing protein [Fibrella rubiginis]MBO0939168.1 carboxypeptidase regulatory-like domain-containing protein [Fibrella rubiginis]
MIRLLLLSFCLLWPMFVSAQNRTIRGRVVDDDNGDPLAGVTIQLRKPVRSVTSGANGWFSLVSPPGAATLLVGFLGYARQTVVIKPGHDTLTIRLRPFAEVLNEVVVTGYGSSHKRDYTGSVAVLSAAESGAPRATFRSSATPGVASSSRTVAYTPGDWQQQAGQLTAGEIYDYSKWTLWQDITKRDLSQYRSLWRQSPAERYSVQLVTPDGFPVIDAPMRLLNSGRQVVWETRTDNTGRGELWANMFRDELDSINIGREKYTVEATVAGKSFTLKKPVLFGRGSNTLTVEQPCQGASLLVDVAFVVDATGSMGDEIAYLKTELTDVINRASEAAPGSKIRLGTVFYRDHQDNYLTRHHDFSEQADSTISFIKRQKAEGGGDFPEAVDTALAVALTQLSWSKVAKTRLLFLVLDAPPHDDEASKASLQRSVAKAATMGIRIIPIAASGINKSTEYLLRAMALATNGTYVFLTDDSGIGDTHIKPTTDQYTVEKLNALLVRLISKFTQTPDCRPVANAKPTERYTEQGTSADTMAVKLPVPDEIKFRFFPNPTRDYLTIENPDTIRELYVMDITGKLLMREAPAQTSVRLDMQPYPTGTYLFRFEAANAWQAGRFLVNK